MSDWTAHAVQDIEQNPEAIYRLFPQAERRGGPQARARLLARVDAHAVAELYRRGDAGERLAILRALPELELGLDALPLVEDALRTNDARLVEAALASSHWLDDHAFRQAVLKCVFMSIPLASISELDRRYDAELARMLADYAAERHAAGRQVPEDVLERL
ncbi:EboA domain-containing protein [Nonomuraea sp. 3N208]|uniref:EboA domain-containing protein n=1 Tax=Nonomuraea sp. 3N208 TaxID=3457421 RepID=UPI003FCDF205